MIRAGDTVKHTPTGETWVVAGVDGDDLAWMGWPDGLARTSDCVAIGACSDEKHRRTLYEVLSKHSAESGMTYRTAEKEFINELAPEKAAVLRDAANAIAEARKTLQWRTEEYESLRRMYIAQLIPVDEVERE